jgi:hypothetical protein
MSSPSVTERLAEIDARITELGRRVAALEGTKDWQKIIGMFKGDEVMKEIDAAGARIREMDRRKTIPRRPKKRSAAS